MFKMQSEYFCHELIIFIFLIHKIHLLALVLALQGKLIVNERL